MALNLQIIWLFLLPIPIACVAWTVTQEKIFEEPRNFCTEKSKNGKYILQRKFFYLFTCEYCFSHYVTLFFLILTDYKLLENNWKGYFIGWFALVWIANVYMSLFMFLRQCIRIEKNNTTNEVKKD